MNEQVNHPAHYQGKMECIDAMVEVFGSQDVETFCQINAFKYLWRAGEKDGNSKEQDEQKAMWYLRKNIDIHCGHWVQTTLTEKDKEELVEKNKNYFLRRIKELKG